MKSSRLRIALLAFLCGTTSLHADILILKNGNKLDGSILQESTESIRFRYRLTPKIWDEKNVLRSEIDQVIKQSPEEVELIELRKVLPTPDLMPADQYEQLIQNRLRPFVNKYKGTPEAKEADGLIGKLQEEKTKVSNGQIKFEGKWLGVDESKGEKYNIQAFELLTKMREQASQGKWSKALEEFEKLSRGSPILRATKYYPTALSEAAEILERWSSLLTKMAADQPVILKQREDGLKKLEGADRDRTRAAILAEGAAWRADVADARARKIRWMDPYKYDLSSIQMTQRDVNQERSRITSMNVETIKAQNEAFAPVLAKIGQGDYTGGAAAFSRVAGFGNPALFKTALQARETTEVLEAMKGELLSIYKQIVAKQSTGAALTRGSSAIGGVAGTGVDDRVARLLAEATGGAAPAAATRPAPGAAAAPGTAIAPGVRPTAAATPAVKPVVAQQPAAAPVARPPQPYVPPAAPIPVPAPVEESNFQTYLLIGAGVLILALLFALMQKKKQA